MNGLSHIFKDVFSITDKHTDTVLALRHEQDDECFYGFNHVWIVYVPVPILISNVGVNGVFPK